MIKFKYQDNKNEIIISDWNFANGKIKIETHDFRYVRSVGMADQVSARKFLEVAKVKNDNLLFHSVFEFFEQRNMKLHNTTAFQKGEHCQAYVQHYKHLFHSAESSSASDTNSNVSSTL